MMMMPRRHTFMWTQTAKYDRVGEMGGDGTGCRQQVCTCSL